MYYKRAIEGVIESASKSFKSILVTGARQVGKSTVLKHMFDTDEYITFDDIIIREETIREPGLFFRNHNNPIILDEVQYISSLFPYIKIACDQAGQYGTIKMTGSQQYHLMKNVSESLAGRVAIIELAGFSLRELREDAFNKPFIPSKEYIDERKKTYSKCNEIWKKIHRGGYPALIDENVDWQMFFSSYVQTYIDRDINELGNVKDKLKFTQFMTALAARTGQMLNYSSLASQLEISVSTVKEWISLLETSGIVYILQPFSNSALTRAIKTPKLYFRDTGLVCYLTRYPTYETAMNGAMAGELFETYVVSEILKSFSNAGLDYRMYISYYRGKDKIRKQNNNIIIGRDSEIDLIIEAGDIIYPVEIKMSANPKLAMADAFTVVDRIAGKKRSTGVILCMYDKPLWLSDNVVSLPIEFV